jgi:hypothetical protein
MKLYDKRDDFNFPIANFPFICSNIPAAPACRVYIDVPELVVSFRIFFFSRRTNFLIYYINKFTVHNLPIVSGFFSKLITRFVTRLTRQVLLVEQELITLPEHLSSPPIFSGVRVTRSLDLYISFVDRCLSLLI